VANYSYIKYRVGSPKATKEDRIIAFVPVLHVMVLKALGDRWRVSFADFDFDGPTWLVTLPGTAVADEKEAMQQLLAPGEDIGFPVSLQPRAIAFRLSINVFTNWAQGCVAEEMADFYGYGIYFDETGRTEKSKTREFRRGKTFREYLARNYDKPLSAKDLAFIDRFKHLVPEGHW
jgi:hypothetical protein